MRALYQGGRSDVPDGSAPASRLELIALPRVPLVRPGDDLADLVMAGLEAAGEALRTGDVLVLAQKIVSKAEDRYVDLRQVTPSPQAFELGRATQKDPRVVELILSEAVEVLRHRPGVIVVAHRLGVVLANAGIDASNVEPEGEAERVLLLPADPDGSCARLRKALRERAGVDVSILINDSIGRAWRLGTVGTALGSAGMPALMDLRGHPDLFGRPLAVTQVALADELAAAASLLQGQADEGRPIVLVRGLALSGDAAAARELIRPRDEDLFR